MTFWTIFAGFYLFVSCCIGLLSLLMIDAAPEEFDDFRSNDPLKRIENVGSVMVLGPIYLLLALAVGRR